jgi:hypothetical protein
MTTSGTYVFSVTRDDIIRQAMLNIGKLGEGQAPTPEETNDCARILNMMVKQWMGKADRAPGLKTWTRRHGHLFLQGNTGQYLCGPAAPGWCASPAGVTGDPYAGTTITATAAAATTTITVASLGTIPVGAISNGNNVGICLDNGNIFWTTVNGAPSGLVVSLAAGLPSQASSGAQVFYYPTTNQGQQPQVIETAFLRDIYNEDTPIIIYRDVADYDRLPSKTDPTNISDPSFIYPEFQLGNTFIYLDVAGAQDVTKHICMTYMEAIQDFNNPADTPEYPQEYFLALAWGLSLQISPMFKVKITPETAALAKEAIMIAKRKEPEVSSAYFQPGIE